MLTEPEKGEENLVQNKKNEKQDTGSNEKKNEKVEEELKRRKKLLAIYLLAGLIVVSIVIFSITFDFFPDIEWGKFECTYYGSGEEIEILNPEYKIKRKYLHIYINGAKIEDKILKFNSSSDFNVTFKIKDKKINMKNMFASTKIKSIKIDSDMYGAITNLESTFENCTFLKKFEFSGYETYEVEKMTKLFYNCTNLEDVNIEKMDTDDLENMDYMFANTNISKIKLTNFEIDQLLNSEGVFQNCNVTIIIKKAKQKKIDELKEKYGSNIAIETE